MNRAKHFVHLLLLSLILSLSASTQSVEAISTCQISAETLEDKIRGGMLAQIIGNLNGLPHEMKYIHEAGKVRDYVPSLPHIAALEIISQNGRYWLAALNPQLDRIRVTTLKFVDLKKD